MTSYLLTFTVYTTAMVGVIFLALFAYKKFSVQNNRVSESNFLEIEDCVTIGVRKQLYVVRAGEEKFLIASDAERTTFLSKLNSETVQKPRKEITSYEAIGHFYPEEERENVRKDATAVLRNIISTGERR
ncbi:MAG: flagellar biosynthetic protein FliO [Fusobacterium sp.]|nr:flagellar biosynthetic protein FliO [Fusobacterium sp.]